MTTLTTTIDGYDVELTIEADHTQCWISASILGRHLIASLAALQDTGRIEHSTSGEQHDVDGNTIERIVAWASENGY